MVLIHNTVTLQLFKNWGILEQVISAAISTNETHFLQLPVYTIG